MTIPRITNNDRAALTEKSLARAGYDLDESGIQDWISDALHWLKVNRPAFTDENFHDLVDCAVRNFEAELEEERCTCAINADGSDELPYDADCPKHGD